ncbi:MAG TPA: hypothetical protein PLY52_10015 [Methanothrix sp.]|nr:hypothetical protein [Methanothrix sp.]
MIKKVVILWLVLLMLDTLGASAQPEEEWNKTYGGPGDESGFAIQEIKDYGYIIVGKTDSFGTGKDDIWLIKTDSKGNELWNRTFGGPRDDIGYSIQETSDSGYIIAGLTESYGAGGKDIWLIKANSKGDKEWDRTFGKPSDDICWSIQETSDHGYILLGDTKSYNAGDFDIWLIKTDSNGTKMWDRTFGKSGNDAGRSVKQTKDGGYVIAGWTELKDIDKAYVWIIKTDPSGTELWNKTIGGSSWDGARSIQETKDGGYIVIGDTRQKDANDQDIWLIKTDSKGNEEWNKTFGGSDVDWGMSVQQARDGGYIIAGETRSYGTGGSDAWVIKTDQNGIEQWNRTFGRTGTSGAFLAQEADDDEYIMLGDTDSYGSGGFDIFMVKMKLSNLKK